AELGRSFPLHQRESGMPWATLDAKVHRSGADGMALHTITKRQKEEQHRQANDWSIRSLVPNPGDDLVFSVRVKVGRRYGDSALAEDYIWVVPHHREALCHHVVLGVDHGIGSVIGRLI